MPAAAFEGLEPRFLLSTASAALRHGYSSLRWHGRDAVMRTAQWILKVDSAKGSPTDQLLSMQRTVHRANKNLNVRRYLGDDGLVLISSGTRAKYTNLLNSLKTLRGFKYLEPNFLLQAATIPDDGFFPNQDDLNNTAQNGGLPDADIDAPEAWDLTTGSPDVVIGVIDSGINYQHQDLAANIWTNPFEIPGDGIDNDGNGYIDDIHGWNFVNDDNDPMDDLGHGTHVAGTIAAVGNNGTDIAGISWSSKLMALKILGADGSGELSAAIAALNYADDMAARGVNIRATNNSYGDPNFSIAMEDAIRTSADAGLLFIAAAGNSGHDADITPFYPASSAGDNIISVAATDNQDQRASFSNYGANSVDIAAPGVSLWSTSRFGGLTTMSGTSMATPHVSGVAALAFSLSPRGTPYSVIRDAILNGGDAIASMSGITTTGKRLNAFGALSQLPLAVIDATPAADEVISTAALDFPIKFSHPIAAASVDAADLSVNDIPADSFAIDNPTTVNFHFNSSPLSAQGAQTMQLTDGSITRQIDGASSQPFTESFRYDALPMRVDSSSIQGAQSSVQVDLNLNEPLNAASLNLSDLQVDQGTLTGIEAIDPQHLRFTISGLDAEVTLHISLPAGAFADQFDNPSLPYSTTLELDRTTPIPLPDPLPHVSPLGSLIRGASATGLINNPADTDTFTIPLLAGQRISLAVVGSDGLLQPSFNLLDADSQSIAGASAAANIAAIENFQITTSGIYSIVIASDGATAGRYAIRASVNAPLEDELLAGAKNDTLQTAQPLDFDSLSNGASRAAIAGQSDLPLGVLTTEIEPNDFTTTANAGSKNFAAAPVNLFQMGIKGNLSSTSDVDFFNLGAFQTGDILSVALNGAGGPRGTLSDPFLELYRDTPDGPLLVIDDDDSGPGIDALINRYVIADAGTYYVKVRAYSVQTGTYDLAMFLENADAAPTTGGPVKTDVEPNNSADAAVNAASSWRAVQYSSTTAGSLSGTDHDMVSYSFHQGDLVTVEVDPSLSLRPRLTLRDVNGNPIAADDGTSRTPDHSAIVYTFTVPTTSTYYVDTFAKSGSGNYTSKLYLTSNFTPPAPTPAPDVYSMVLDAGQQASLILHNSGSGSLSLELQNFAGVTLAGGGAIATSGEQAIASFIAPAAGTYYARISGDRFQDYTLVVTRDSAFDLGSNDNSATPQSIGAASNVLGYIDGEDDWYSLPISAGYTIGLSVDVLGADDTLQPSLELYDPAGALVSSGGAITAKAGASGGYLIHISGAGSGEYLLRLTRFWALAGTSGDDQFYVRRNDPNQTEIFVNTALDQPPTYTLAQNQLSTIGIASRGGDDHLTIDGVALQLAQPPASTLLDLTLRGNAQLSLQGSPALAGLHLEDTSRVALTSSHHVLRLSQIEIAPDARLDLQDGSLILEADETSRTAMLDMLTQRLHSARGNGDWTGPGILTSTLDPDRLFTLGIMLNDNSGVPIKLTFAGQAVDANSILLGYALIGDTNLDGDVDSDDYARIDASFASHPQNPTYADGDFDYSGSINSDDYFYIDRAFASQ